jgi:predicted dienelactone hydrolase
MSRFPSRVPLFAALIPFLLFLAGSGEMTADATAVSTAETATDVRVGHSVMQMDVTGSLSGEHRLVDVHLWYPTRKKGFSDAPITSYTSTLHEVPLTAQWDALAWTIDARLAREVPLNTKGKPLPVIVFSHGNQNDPIDYAYTLESIAADGFLVAAPAHVNNTQDDVRRDFVNTRAGFQLLPCLDGLLGRCSTGSVPRSMVDRVRDIRSVLASLPAWYGHRADMSRVGVMGHSRGTVTALAAAGGSATWGIASDTDKDVKAVMGLAIGGAAVTFGVDLGNVKVPALLLSGSLDRNSVPKVSEDALARLGSVDKSLVSVVGATHRTFDSTYCAQMQAAGAVVVADEARYPVGERRAILDRHTLTGEPSLPPPAGPTGILTAPNSGTAMDYCSFESFAQPVDIRSVVASITGAAFPANVPITGLDTETVREQVTTLAVEFFRRTLGCTDDEGEECED